LSRASTCPSDAPQAASGNDGRNGSLTVEPLNVSVSLDEPARMAGSVGRGKHAMRPCAPICLCGAAPSAQRASA
jgi:hypothetical protein